MHRLHNRFANVDHHRQGMARLVMLGQAGQQLVHFAHGRLQGFDHVSTKFGLLGMAFGVARQDAQLADQIFDIVRDKCEATVELFELLAFGQSLLARRLGQIAGQLAANDAKHIEIFPIKRARQTRPRQYDEAGQLTKVNQWHDGPRLRFIIQPLRNSTGITAFISARPHLVHRYDMAGRFEKGHRLRGDAIGWHIGRGPVPACLKRQAAIFVRNQQETSRAIENIGQRFNHTLIKGRGFFGRKADGIGKAHPFRPVIIAVLKEVFGDDHIQPAFEPPGRQDQKGGE